MPKNGELRLAAVLRFLHIRLDHRLQGCGAVDDLANKG